MNDGINIKNHPSFGLISFSRVQSSKSHQLFGSSIKHQNTIILSIDRADETRHLNKYWYHSIEPIVQVEMSYSQFTEAMVNMNTLGVPCTIKRILKDKVSDCPDNSQRELFEKEFRSKILKITEDIFKLKDEADIILNTKGSIKASEKQKLIDMLRTISTEIKHNLPYIQKSYSEALDKTTMEAKIEIEAFMTHQVSSLGLEQFKKQFLEIGEKDGTNQKRINDSGDNS